MKERIEDFGKKLKRWIRSPLPIKGAGGGRLDFDKPFMVDNLVYSRTKLITPETSVAQDIANNVDRLLNLKEGDILLDLGCGPGIVASYLVPKLGSTGWLYCVDASEAMLKHSSKVLWGKNSTLIHGDIHTVDKLVPEKADAAILSGNVHLLTDRKLAFEAIRDTLTPNGKLAVVCHAYFYRDSSHTNAFASLIDRLRETRPDLKVDGLRLPMMSEKELNDIMRLIRNVGFSVSAYESDTWSPDTEDVFGHPATETIKTRLKIVKRDLTPSQLITEAELILGDVSAGRQAQIYLLCERKEPSLKVPASIK